MMFRSGRSGVDYATVVLDPLFAVDDETRIATVRTVMPSPASSPSPMALSRSPTPSIFKKKPTPAFPPMPTAVSYLSAVSEADARARVASTPPTTTPALSLSSSLTSSSDDVVLGDDDASVYDNSDGLVLPLHPPTSEQVFTTAHTEFGHCANDRYRYQSQHPPGAIVKAAEEQDPPYYILLSTYISYLILICIGHVRDFVGKRLNPSSYKHLMPHDVSFFFSFFFVSPVVRVFRTYGSCPVASPQGYAPLNSDFDSFYTRRLKTRLDDCFSNPITGVAGRTVLVLDRHSDDFNRTHTLTGARTRALNISSYNYLGFAQSSGGCADAVEESLKRYGVSSCGSRLHAGTNDLHILGEALVARFVGMEDALISSMGFATNSTFIPAMVGKGCLVISDELNHASIRFGVRLSDANVRMFKHNDMNSLEALLKEVISQGQPKTHRPWKKILLIVEGLYSMEGTMANIPKILELKRKYKARPFLSFFDAYIDLFMQFYLFVDEAHSIGALGPNGRGVADYFNVPPRSIDVLMGTFTKSFGAAGGYIAGSKVVIDKLRLKGHSGPYAEAMTPPVLTQVIASMASIMGISTSLPFADATTPFRLPSAQEEHHPGPAPASAIPTWMALTPALRDGSEGRLRLRRLAFNSRYLARGLRKLGFITYGQLDSPVVPLLLFNPGKMPMFHRLMKQRGTPVVVVVVGYPATPLVTSRVRFCVSASHTKDDMDVILRACDEIGDLLDLKHGEGDRWPVEEIVNRAVELVNMPNE